MEAWNTSVQLAYFNDGNMHVKQQKYLQYTM